MVQPSDRMPASPTQLSVWPVAIGGVIGILVGLFLGDYAHLIRPVGEVYVLLLEVAVYPYLICSLLHGLGSMAPAQAWRLFRSGWKFYVALWGITFGLLILLAHGIPQASSISLVADAAEKGSPGLLEILIPSDPFTALSRNYVPAVVLFCLFYGATQRLARACGIEDPDTGEIVRTNISVAYPLGQLGNFDPELSSLLTSLSPDSIPPHPLAQGLRVTSPYSKLGELGWAITRHHTVLLPETPAGNWSVARDDPKPRWSILRDVLELDASHRRPPRLRCAR